MNITLIRAMLALAPAGMLFSGSAVLFIRERTAHSFLQLVGGGSLVVVVLTHISEALQLFPWMGWGREHSAGHYANLGSAVLAVTLFPLDICFTRLENHVRSSDIAFSVAPDRGGFGHVCFTPGKYPSRAYDVGCDRQADGL